MFATVERSPDRLAANPAHVEPLTGRERLQGAAVAFWRVSGRENTTNRHGGRVSPLCFAGFVFSHRIQARKIGGADGLPDRLPTNPARTVEPLTGGGWSPDACRNPAHGRGGIRRGLPNR